MRSLIIGSGLVGSALKKCLPDALVGRRDAMYASDQAHADLNDYASLLNAFSNHRPDVVYLPAANTNVDACEDKSTNQTNVLGAYTIISLCEQFDAKLVYFSSSYVFDGESSKPYLTIDIPNPINQYGRQKRLVETAVQSSYGRTLIIRTVGVFGEEKTRKNFGKSVLARVFKGEKVLAPTDQHMNPILSTELAKIAIHLAEKQQGLFHVAGDTCLSKYEFAMRLAGMFGPEAQKFVVPVCSDELGQRAKRPKMGCLDCSELHRLGLQVPSFNDALMRFVESDYYS